MKPVAMIHALVACAVCLFFAPPAAEAAEPVEIPINVGLGPAFFFGSGAIEDEQAPHFGVQLDIGAIIDRRTLRKHRRKIPKKFRKAVAQSDEIKISKIYIPDHLVLSPRTKNTAIFGGSFKPISLAMPLVKSPVRLSVSAGLLLTYLFIDTEFDDEEDARESEMPEGTTHFLRPGLDLKAELTVPLSETLLLSAGWSSALYIPQELGGDVFEAGDDLDNALFHMGRAFVVLHFRIPYKTRI